MHTFVKPRGKPDRAAADAGATSPVSIKAKCLFRSRHGGTEMSCEEAIWSGMHGDVTGDQSWELFPPSCSVWLIRFPQIARWPRA